MAEEDKEQRTEEATEKKRNDARQKGRFAQSKEATSAVVLLGILSTLYIFGSHITNSLKQYMGYSLSRASAFELNAAAAPELFFGMMKTAIFVVGPVAAVIMILGLVINIYMGGGIVLASDPIMPKLTKLDPLKGFGRIFSKNGLSELVKSILKIIVVGVIAFFTVKNELDNIPALMDQEGWQILYFISWVSLKIVFYTFLVMIVLGAVDFAFQKYIFEESLKMTKQEIKDERKDTEGDPKVKARIRSVQLEMARRRMMEEVPKADVVITNPTHFAIAIRYDGLNMGAPQVVAKGTGFVAQKIKEVAKNSNVPMVENKPLARMLYKVVDVGGTIPVELYKAVAEILAYVYRLKGKV